MWLITGVGNYNVHCEDTVVTPNELIGFVFFFFNDTATTEIYTLSLHDALPISHRAMGRAGSP